MSKINVLDSFVFNRISAGEVVERPCSAVKELVENSIDSGATNIYITIVGGGLEKIEVVDNGCGIEFSDLKKAFMPHATSKIRDVDDLDNISTLGFRGEALASIASVSNVELISKTADSEFGGKIKANAGIIGEPSEVGTTNGTRIVVENLFYNVPARLKFMRKPKTEENDITNYVARLILANPHISFTYVADGKTIYKHNSSDLLSAMLSIYGNEVYQNLIEVASTAGNVSIHGYIGRPEISKANRTYQTQIINGRYVVNNLISSAVANVYEDYLMKGKFPLFVLDIKIPYQDVDVNVHPSKLEVKFKNNNAIFSLVNSACFEALNATNFTKSLGQTDLLSQVAENDIVFEYKNNSTFENSQNQETKIKISMPEGQSFSDISKEEDKSSNNVLFESKTSLLGEIILTNTPGFNKEKVETKQDKLFEAESPIKYLCTLFDTYIMVECNSEVFLIDQHAAHERIIYDRLVDELAKNEVATQDLLFAYTFRVNEQEENFLLDNINILEQIGFRIVEFGNLCYKVEQIPYILSNINLKDYFENLFKNLSSYINKPLSFIKDDLCQKACKSATKGGDKLMDSEIRSLIEELKTQKTTLLCPHGRPICVCLSQSDIEKWFKRKL